MPVLCNLGSLVRFSGEDFSRTCFHIEQNRVKILQGREGSIGDVANESVAGYYIEFSLFHECKKMASTKLE